MIFFYSFTDYGSPIIFLKDSRANETRERALKPPPARKVTQASPLLAPGKFHARSLEWALLAGLFSFGCHVIDRAYASTDCTDGVGETIKRKGGMSQACLGKSKSFILDIHNMVN